MLKPEFLSSQLFECHRKSLTGIISFEAHNSLAEYYYHYYMNEEVGGGSEILMVSLRLPSW